MFLHALELVIFILCYWLGNSVSGLHIRTKHIHSHIKKYISSLTHIDIYVFSFNSMTTKQEGCGCAGLYSRAKKELVKIEARQRMEIENDKNEKFALKS